MKNVYKSLDIFYFDRLADSIQLLSCCTALLIIQGHVRLSSVLNAFLRACKVKYPPLINKIHQTYDLEFKQNNTIPSRSALIQKYPIDINFLVTICKLKNLRLNIILRKLNVNKDLNR